MKQKYPKMNAILRVVSVKGVEINIGCMPVNISKSAQKLRKMHKITNGAKLRFAYSYYNV